MLKEIQKEPDSVNKGAKFRNVLILNIKNKHFLSILNFKRERKKREKEREGKGDKEDNVQLDMKFAKRITYRGKKEEDAYVTTRRPL